MSRFNYSEPLAPEKPPVINGSRFSSGEEICGISDEGQEVKGRVTAIGEKTYRIESYGRSYTIPMENAKYIPEEKVDGQESKS